MFSHKVIIVGAGMAGIKTAIDLLAGGTDDVLVLEARDRLGGRLVSVPSTKDPRVSYDLGALWFHDALVNPLLAKARKLRNVDIFFDDGKHMLVAEHAAHIPDYLVQDIMMEMRAFAAVLYTENPQLPDMSVQQLCLLYLKQQKHFLTSEQIKYAPQVLRMWDEMWGGVSWDLVSVKLTYLAEGEDHIGRNAFVYSGYNTVFQNELQELPQKFQDENIKTNVKVDSIDYTDPSLVKLKTATGEIYTCEYVVVTVPYNVLSGANPLKWTPSLPQNIAKILAENNRGSLGKVVLEFDRCFWPEDVNRFYCLASEDSIEGAPRPWKHPTLIVNYYAMTRLPSLVFLTQDPLSGQLENMTNDEIWALFQPVLQKIATSKVEKPFNIYTTKWNQDPFTQGAYTMPHVGDSSTSDVCKALAGGVTKRIRFAGAETQAGSANGCAHGAWYSAQREAAFVLDQINRDQGARL